MPTYTEEAERIRKQYAARLESLRNRRDLSDEGRRRQIARLKTETSDALRKLAKEDTEATEARKRRLLERAFGNTSTLPSQAVAQRDALDRAAKIKTAKEAADALALAKLTGDHGLAKAIAMRAYNNATGHPIISSEWAKIVNEWAEGEHPSVDEALTELSELHHDSSSHQARLIRNMQYTVSEPAELSGKNAEHLAAQADQEEMSVE